MSSNISSTGSNGISFSGLSSGIDTNSMVTALMNYERLPITRLETQVKTVNKEKSVVQELSGLISTLRDKAAALYGATALQGKTATSADEKVVKASAGAGAAAGTYNVTVTSLAQTHTMASGASPALAAGTGLDITVGSSTKSVAVEAGDTLQTLADRINGTSDVGVSASVINDKLVLISGTGGTGGTMTVGGTAAASLGMTTSQAAADAQAVVNGVAVTASGNKLDGSVSGLTLDLTGTGTTTVTVGTDTSSITDQVKGFVTAYNAAITNMRNATMYDAATKTAGTLQGDTTFTSFAGQLRGIAGAAVSGMGGAYNSLAQIGITSSRSGELSLDEGKLKAALAADPGSVKRVFGFDDGTAGVQGSDGIARQIQNLANDFVTNSLTDRISGYGERTKRMTDKIAQLEDVMTVREDRLKKQFQAMESAIAKFKSQAASFTTTG